MQQVSMIGLGVAVCSLLAGVGARAQSDTDAVLILNQHAQGAGDSQLILLGGPDDLTLKSLREIEPRTPLNPPGDDVMLPASATAVISIAESGSYVLTGNITGVSGQHGVEILVSNVTLDLNGFALVGRPNALSGISAPTGVVNISITNGAIRGWPGRGIDGERMTASSITGVSVGNSGDDGIKLGQGTIVNCTSRQNQGDGIRTRFGKTVISSCSVELNKGNGLDCGEFTIVHGVSSSGNTKNGIRCDEGTNLFLCSASDNGLSGISVAKGCVVANCTTTTNGLHGIEATDGCVIKHCNAYENSGHGVSCLGGCSVIDTVAEGNLLTGISLGSGGIASGCAASLNKTGISGDSSTITGCAATANSESGITMTGSGGIVERCRSNANAQAGIDLVGTDARIIGNSCANNTLRGIWVQGGASDIIDNRCTGGATGIDLAGQGSTADGNRVQGASTGILVGGQDNFVVRNTVINTTTGFMVSGSNQVGSIKTSPGGAKAWDNFDF